ncbi:unnamed protein product [Protopolystoma xenopodis]|uniref:Uncharacterized protein n=1 Tax=Protopolystoma xenopodis TaxID=117903 RepID=A0A448XB48_9PLAT|nr:unnamed protein product [Protopolystoma xenopodis]
MFKFPIKQFDCRPFQGPKTPPSPRVLREVCTTSDPRNLSPISPVSPEARSYSVEGGNRFVPYYYYQHRRYKKTGDTEQKFQGDKRESYQSQSRDGICLPNFAKSSCPGKYMTNYAVDHSGIHTYYQFKNTAAVPVKSSSHSAYSPLNQRRRNCRYTDFSESRSSRNISNADVSSSRNLPEYINRNEQPRMRYNIPKTNEHSQRSQSSSSCSLADYELSYKPEDYGNIKRYQRTSNESYRRCGNSTFKCPYPRISEEKTAIKQGRSSGFRDGISREINNTLARRIRQRTESESSASTYHQDSDRQSRTCSSKASTSRSSSSSAGSSFSGSSSSVASGDKSSSGSSTRSSSLRLRSKSIKEASTRSSSYRSTEILSKPSKDKATPKITKEEEQEECDNGRTIFNEFKNISRDISSNSQTSLVLSKFVQIEEISVKRSPSNMDTDEDEKIVEKDSAGTAKLSHDFNKNVQYNEGEEGEILSESESELLSDAVPKSVGGQTEVRLPTIWEVEGKQAECHQEDSSSEITFTASSQYSPKEREKWTENSSISKEGKRRSGWLPSQIASEFIKKPCVTSFDSRLASFKRSSPVLRCKVGHQKTNSLKSSRSNLSLNYKDEGVIRARPTNRRLYNGKPWLHFCPATHTRSADSPCQKRARIGKFNDAATCIRNRALQFRTIGTRQIHDRAKDARFVLARRVKDIQSRNNFLRLNRHGYNRRAYRRS